MINHFSIRKNLTIKYLSFTDHNIFYYKNRYYNSTQGRFISRDPIGYEDGMGLYEYPGNSPINTVDIEGLSKIPKLPKIPGYKCYRAIRAWKKASDDAKKKCDQANKHQVMMWNCINQAIANGKFFPTSSLLSACAIHCQKQVSTYNISSAACSKATLIASAKAGHAARACGWPF